jgi:adenine/guanine/hypoxanthine permease
VRNELIHPCKTHMTLLAKFFRFDSRGTSTKVETLAGISTFLSLSYIFVVNPAILSQAGMDKGVVLFATIVTSALATIAMGLLANLPFVLAPGMEINAYVAFFVVGTLGFTWQQALGAVFWSGIIFIVLTITRIREQIINAIPEKMKAGLALCVGVFLAMVALKISGILLFEGIRVRGLGDLTSRPSLAAYASISITLLLIRFRVQGAVLISIILSSIIAYFLGVGSDLEPSTVISIAMLDGIGKADMGVIVNPKALNVILILFVIDFYGSIAKFIGLAMKTSMIENGKLSRIREALLIDGTGTVFGSILGTTSIIVYVESAVGIAAGGRTGLTAVICGFLMLCFLLLAPLIKFVPIVAATGALIFVAIKLCPSIKDLKEYSKIDLLVLLIMQVIVIVEFAIDRAMLAGFLAYIVYDLWHQRRLNPYLIASAALLIIGTFLQVI